MVLGIDWYLVMQHSWTVADEFLENWTIQARKGLLELGVLSAIASGRKYGYEIVRELDSLRGLGMSEGTIYPILSRLRKEGLAEATLEDSNEGPARKYYELTARGRRQLTDMRRYWDEIVAAMKSLKG